MKAAILRELNAPLLVADIAVPQLQWGQVLVEVHCATICGAQIREITGAKGPDDHLPHLLGHEGGGIVVDVGQGVTKVKQDDHVVMHWRKGSGIEAPFAVYDWGEDKVGAGKVATFNELAVVSENRVTKIDNDVPYDVASLLGCAATTGLGVINNEAKLKMGRTIAVAGAGGVGLFVIQGAAMVSASKIIAIDVSPAKLAMAKLYGATHTFGLLETQSLDGLREMIGPRGVDVFVDCTGAFTIIDIGYSFVAPGGKLILVGQTFHQRHLVISSMDQHYCGKTMFDSQGGLTDPDVDIPCYIELYKQGKLKFDGIVTHRFPLDEVNEAIQTMMRSTNAGRIALEMGHE
jgi:S-(hydroxymethyl)glutathione dehydrogenase/alcohol dehydrogenase